MGKFEDIIQETMGTLKDKPGDGKLSKDEESALRRKAEMDPSDTEAKRLVDGLNKKGEEAKRDAKVVAEK